MLTFFRRIRKGLLGDGATSKYLLYAIGEIALVVIGILIALQINNSNELLKESKIQNQYLMNLSEDFRLANIEFERNQFEHKKVKESFEQILNWAELGAVPIEQHSSFDSVFGGVFWRSSFDPPLGTVETILSSGNINIIQNQELASLLTQWSSIVDDYRTMEDQAVDHFYQEIYPFISNHVNLQDLDKGIPTNVPWPHDPTNAYLLVSNQKFQNLIYWHWVIQWNIETASPKLSKSLLRILQLTQGKVDSKE